MMNEKKLNTHMLMMNRNEALDIIPPPRIAVCIKNCIFVNLKNSFVLFLYISDFRVSFTNFSWQCIQVVSGLRVNSVILDLQTAIQSKIYPCTVSNLPILIMHSLMYSNLEVIMKKLYLCERYI